MSNEQRGDRRHSGGQAASGKWTRLDIQGTVQLSASHCSGIHKLHGNVHAKPFLDKVEHLLLADDVDRKAWPRLLLKAVPDVHDSSWVKLNILEANVDWSTARHLFTAQFEVLTWTEQSQQLYEQCRQGAREPVQEYSHRFMTCVTELQHEDDDQHVILHFQLGLIPFIQAKIRDRVHLYRDLQKLSGFSNGSLTSSAPSPSCH